MYKELANKYLNLDELDQALRQLERDVADDKFGPAPQECSLHYYYWLGFAVPREIKLTVPCEYLTEIVLLTLREKTEKLKSEIAVLHSNMSEQRKQP